MPEAPDHPHDDLIARLADRLEAALRDRLAPPECLTFDEAAALLSISRSKLYDWNTRGLCPAPLEVDGLKRFGRRELVAWVAAGMPPRARWQHLRAAALDRIV